MMIIGCDFHPRYQQIAMMDTETGELAGSIKGDIKKKYFPLRIRG